MSPTKIGYFDRGALSIRRDVNANETNTKGVTYDQALARTRATAGADLVIARQNGNSFTYDVYDVSIQKNNQVAGAGQFLHLVDNVPGTLDASEAVLVDESNNAQVLLPSSDGDSATRGRRAVTHARSRDLEGALALTTSISDSTMRTQLSQVFEGLKSTRQDLEQREATLRGQLQQAQQALTTKRAPYDRAVTDAENILNRTSSQQAAIVSGKQEALREARTPGIHQAEAEVSGRDSERNSAQGALNDAQQHLSTAEGQIADADRMRAELNSLPFQISTVQQKLSDYDQARRGYDFAMRQYNADRARYEQDLRAWEQANQNQPSGSGFQNQPSGSGFQNQPSGSSFQNQPSGSSFQNQPSGSGFQNQPSGSPYQTGGSSFQNQPSGSPYQSGGSSRPRPIAPVEPTMQLPSSWAIGDSESSLRDDLTRMQSRSVQLATDEANTRSQGERGAASARDQIRTAQDNVARAEDRLEAARTRLQNLPAGNPATIQQAERALSTAQSAQSAAVTPLQTKLSQAREALDTNTQQERAKVAQVQADLQAAPEAYMAAVGAAEQIVNNPPAPTPTTPTTTSSGGTTPKKNKRWPWS